jgi:hypothetical protein
MVELGKALLGLGLLLVVIRAAVLMAARFGLLLGRLPGDVSYQREGRDGLPSAWNLDPD